MSSYTVAELEVLIVGRVDQLEKEMAKATGAINSFSEKASATLQKTTEQLAAKAGALGRSMTMGITLPLLAVAAGASKMSADFGDAMAKVEGAAGAGHTEIEALRGKVLQLAEATGKAPKDLAEGLYFVESMGYRGAAAMDILNKSARLSAGGLGTTADIAKTVTFAVNAYGVGNLNAAKATDVLAAAVREGAMAPDAMAGAIGRVLPEASRMGIGFDKLAGSMAAMTRIGLSVDEAVTAIRQTMLTLDHPSKQTQKALASVGLTAGEVAAHLRTDFIGTLGVLAKASEHGGEAFQRIFPNVRAFTGVLALTGKQSKEVAALIDRVTHSVGSAGKIFDVASNTAGFKYRQALQALSVAAISLGDTLAPAMVRVADAVKDMADRWSSATPQMQAAVVAILAVVAAVGPLLLLFGKLAQSIKAIIELRTAYVATMTAAGVSTAAALIPIAALTLGRIAVATAFKLASDASAAFSQQETAAATRAGQAFGPGDYINIRRQQGSKESVSQLMAEFKKHKSWMANRDHLMPTADGKPASPLFVPPKIDPLKLGAPIGDGKEGKKETEAYQSALNSLKSSIANVGNATELHKAQVSRLYDEYAKLTPAHWLEIKALAGQLDAVKAADKAHETYTSTLKDLTTTQNSLGVTTEVGALRVRQLSGEFVGIKATQVAHLYAVAALTDVMKTHNAAVAATVAMAQKLTAALGDQRRRHLELTASTDIDRISIEQFGKTFEQIQNVWIRLIVQATASQKAKNATDQQAQETTKALRDLYAGMVADKVHDIATMRLQTDMDRLKYEVTSGNLKNLTSMQKTYLLILQQTVDATQKQIDYQAKMKQFWKDLADAAKAQADQVTAKVKEMADKLSTILVSGLDSIHKKGFQGFFQSVLSGFDDMLKQMAQAWLKSQVSAMLASALTPKGTNAPHKSALDLGLMGAFMPRAIGGPVTGGVPYMVGENGPELFTPGSSGNVTRNSDLGHGGGHTFNTTVNIHPRDNSEMTMEAASEHAAQIGRLIQRQLRRN